MKSIALAAGVFAAAAAGTALAEPYYRDYRDYRDYREYRDVPYSRSGYECWNPRAGHFEGVREGERQNDLDFSRCRRIDERYRYSREYRDVPYSRSGYECWNPHARHYEEVRDGERQDDLDFSRCRTADGSYAYRYYR